MINTKAIKILGFSIVIALIAGSSYATWSVYKSKEKNDIINDVEPQPQHRFSMMNIDTALISRFSKAYQKLDVSRKEFLIEGVMNATDGADSTQFVHHRNYIFSKKNQLFYYKLDQVEVFNTEELSIYVDHATKQVMIAEVKEVGPSNVIPDLNLLTQIINSEGYTLQKKMGTNLETITISNPEHITCKEIQLSFDPITLTPQKLHIRLTDQTGSEGANLDKLIDLDVTRTENNSLIRNFLAKKIVVKKNNKWQLEKGYQDYELINVL